MTAEQERNLEVAIKMLQMRWPVVLELSTQSLTDIANAMEDYANARVRAALAKARGEA